MKKLQQKSSSVKFSDLESQSIVLDNYPIESTCVYYIYTYFGIFIRRTKNISFYKSCFMSLWIYLNN